MPVNFNPADKTDDIIRKDIQKKAITLRERIYPILGKNNERIKEEDHLLYNCEFYLISGHGGPDPGAQSEKEGEVNVSGKIDSRTYENSSGKDRRLYV